VFALPGRVDNPLSAGPHLLIRDGAIITTKLEDIVTGLGPVPQGVMEPSLFPEVGEDEAGATAVEAAAVRDAASGGGLSERQQLILSGIGADSADVDTIVERTALPAHVVLQELTFLSLKGQLRRVDGQTYARRNGSNR
jgi:DNA processing protein